MAKHPKRRKFNLRKVRNANSLLVTALATQDLVKGALTAAVVATTRVVSMEMTWGWSDIAAAIDDGLEFGVAHSDYTAAEIEEALEANSSMDMGDKIRQEQANRLIRSIGVITGSSIVGGGIQFNDGKPIKTRLNWLLNIGDTLDVWVRNSSGVVYSDGSSLTSLGKLWVTP